MSEERNKSEQEEAWQDERMTIKQGELQEVKKGTGKTLAELDAESKKEE